MKVNNYLFILGLIHLALLNSHCGSPRQPSFFQENKTPKPSTEINPKPSNPSTNPKLKIEISKKNIESINIEDPTSIKPTIAKPTQVLNADSPIIIEEKMALDPVPAPKTTVGRLASPARVQIILSPIAAIEPIPNGLVSLESLLAEDDRDDDSDYNEDSDTDEVYVSLDQVMKLLGEDSSLSFDQAIDRVASREGQADLVSEAGTDFDIVCEGGILVNTDEVKKIQADEALSFEEALEKAVAQQKANHS